MILGFYGKIPAHGDFIQRNGAVDFIRKWDRWLQEGITASRVVLGRQWQTLYENAPIWRFYLGGGVCGKEPVLGVMMPSQDRVGRCFPLTVFARLDRPVSVGALDNDPFMTTLEGAALNTLGAGQDKMHLSAALQNCPVPELPKGEASATSHWLSVFFGGTERRDHFSHNGLPTPKDFTQLLDPGFEVGNV